MAWISLNDRRPDDRDSVLAFGRGLMDDKKFVYPVTVYIMGKDVCFSPLGSEDDGYLGGVTHWMPYPDGPAER